MAWKQSSDPNHARVWGSSFLVLTAWAVQGCSGDAWLAHPAGPPADAISRLSLVFGGVAVVVWVVTVAVITWAVVRGRRRSEPAIDPGTRRVQARAVVAATVLMVLILFALALTDYAAARGLQDLEGAEDALTVEVTGHQWWWELTYEPDDPARRFTTANELRVPLGRPVRLRLTSRDVIHSFWVPRLQGKRDLIPGYQNTLWIQADEAGIYRGGCAEFCGRQHAKMRLEVIVEPPERFSDWYTLQLTRAAPPTEPLTLAGRDVFVTARCALCHSVRGTPARGQVGPDLTHLGSRRTIAAGVLPNTRGYLAGWIVDPQHIKPGVHMPQNPLPSTELHALLHYLESLR